MKFILIIAACLTLCACSATKAQQQAEQLAAMRAKQQAAFDECKVKYPTAPRKNNVAYARCVNDVNAAYVTSNPDIADLLAVKRVAIATQMDEGEISQENGEALIAQARSEAVAELQRRQSVAAQQQSARASTGMMKP